MTGLNLVRGITETPSATITTERHPGWSQGYVARITLSLPGDKYDLSRVFVRSPDFQSLSRSGNGHLHYDCADMPDGWYEADSVYRSYRSHRVYFRVESGEVVEWTESKTEMKKALSA